MIEPAACLLRQQCGLELCSDTPKGKKILGELGEVGGVMLGEGKTEENKRKEEKKKRKEEELEGGKTGGKIMIY